MRVAGDHVGDISVPRCVDSDGDSPALPLDVKPAAFQWRVWRALQAISLGQGNAKDRPREPHGNSSVAFYVSSANEPVRTSPARS
jgi:hypothetical protein